MTTMLEKMKAQMAQAMTLSGVSSITISAEPLPRDKANPTHVEFPPMFDLDAIARAALQAIREPDRAMIRAGVDGIDEVEGDCATEDGAAAGFTAMIDAILAEPDRPT